MRASVELFEDQGFEDTTVEQIVQRANCSPRTFYRYFRAKEDVLFGDQAERLELLRQALAATEQSEKPFQVARSALIDQVVGFSVLEDPELEARCIELWSLPGVRGRWAEIVFDWEQVVTEYLAREWKCTPHAPDCRINAMIWLSIIRMALVGVQTGGRDRVRAIAEKGFNFIAEEIGLVHLSGSEVQRRATEAHSRRACS
ncbi:transcriptional regulator, TetR family [Haloechinothrix alba]|uniref:Transcriptional regulator, TetR family n=2 Tax=Haloechinothrix alba TaxID=664784 RepID=A0A239AU66_9PSEU|nr:transcriptional regulator, TetR family [Haloechinothrix alba]